MSFLAGLLPELKAPETTTIIRWILRLILVFFLAWIVRKRSDQEEEEDGEEDEASAEPQVGGDGRRTGGGARQRPPHNSRMPGGGSQRLPKRDLYANPAPLRQRRPYPDGAASGGGQGGGMDFEAVIEKISKPREMWEVRQGPPQILRQQRREEGGEAPSAADAGAATAAGAAAAALAASLAAPSERPRLNLAPRRASAEAKDAQGGEEKMLHGHERPVTFITWNRDGNLLFTCGKDKLVCVWSLPDGECLGQYKGHAGAVWSCSVTGDSKWLVTCGADQLVIVWEARESRELARMELPGVARGVEWAGIGAGGVGDGERFAACHNRFGSHPAAVRIFHFDGTAISERLSITDLPTPASQVRWGKGDELIATAHENGELVFWRADSGAEAGRLKAHDSAISKFDFSHDRELVATASPDKSVRIWDLGAGAEWRLLYQAETDRPLNAVALGPVDRSAAVGAASRRPARCCVIAAGGQDARDVTTSSSSTEQFGTLKFKLGASEEFPCDLQADGVTKGHFGPVHTLAFARDGSAIASGSEDGCARVLVFAGGAAAAVEGAGASAAG